MQHDPAVITGICRAVELAIERAVRLSPGTATQLQGLHPLDVAIHCTEPTISIFAFIDAAGMVKLASYRETKPTVAIEATWRDFGKLATAADPAAALINGDIKISGDTAPLLQVQRVISDLDVDWEAPLVDALGPLLGHQIANIVRAIVHGTKSTHRRVKRQVSEFILEEGRLSPSAGELDAFFSDIDDLVLRADRVESRLTRLKKRVSTLVETVK